MKTQATAVAARFVRIFPERPMGETVREIRAAVVMRRNCARNGHKLTISLGWAGPDSGGDGASCVCGRNSFSVTMY